MPLYPGLLISTKRNSERSASSEIHFVLTNKLEIEADLIHVADTRISGLITVKLDQSVDTHQLIRDMIALEKEDSYFMHCLKIRPIDHTLGFELDNLVKHIENQQIDRPGTFRIMVNKRHNPIASLEVIKPIANLFPNNKVDLNEPDWEIWIEIVAYTVGYAVIEPELVFSTDLAYVEEDDNVPNWFLD